MKKLITTITLLFCIFINHSFTGQVSGSVKKVKVFILAGQSNMEGKAKIKTLEYQATQSENKARYAHMRDNNKWKVRKDVWIKFLDRKGDLTVGYGSPGCIGPELDFGHIVGDAYDGQVLIIKTAWGGKSLTVDFRPPGSGMQDDEVLKLMLEKMNKVNKKKGLPAPAIDDVKEKHGYYYRLMIKEVKDTLVNLKTHFPSYQGQGYEISGFVWFQGWNDMIKEDYTAQYDVNMQNFIRDIRKDFKALNLPFIVGQLGVGGKQKAKTDKREKFKQAQAGFKKNPEFNGNAELVKTDIFWDKKAQALYDISRDRSIRKKLKTGILSQEEVDRNKEEFKKYGSNQPYHYLGSPLIYCDIGRAFALAILKLRNNK